MKRWTASILGTFLLISLTAQSNLIQWSNPSFEDMPGPGRPPLGWYFCGPAEETPPDVHPVSVMHVTQKAKHGKTYAGLVVRDNGTRETLGQALAQPLKAGQCYLLRLYISRSSVFSSFSRLNGRAADFAQPIRLQLWGGSQHCKGETLLAESPLNTDTTWQLVEWQISPPADCNQLFFSAAYENNADPYNGHLLVDHLSPFIPVDCSSSELLFDPDTSGDYKSFGDSSDLKTKVQKEIKDIRWVRDGFSLEQDFLPLTNNPGAWICGNKAIYRITQYLKAHPESLLTVVVGPRKDRFIQHHIRLLAAEFLAAGLPPDRCLIRPMKRKDRHHENWLVAESGEPDLFWGVSQ